MRRALIFGYGVVGLIILFVEGLKAAIQSACIAIARFDILLFEGCVLGVGYREIVEDGLRLWLLCK